MTFLKCSKLQRGNNEPEGNGDGRIGKPVRLINDELEKIQEFVIILTWQ